LIMVAGRSESAASSRCAQRPIFRQLPLFRISAEAEQRRGRWQAWHCCIANKIVGQPQRAADATEAEPPASPVAESHRALKTAVRVVST
jgi:hypothetical protein